MSIALSTRPTQRADAFEAAWSSMADCWFSSGIWAEQLSRGEPFADSTGLVVKVRSLKAWVQGFHGEREAESAIGIASNSSGQPRIDRVVLRLTRAVPATVSLEVISGAPAVTPVAPTLTQNSAIWEIRVARVLVGAGAATINPTDVIDEREWAVPRVNAAAGTMQAYPGTIAPAGYLIMAGQTVNRQDFPALAAVLGITSPTFAVPDMRGFMLRGAANPASVNALAGSDTVALSAANNGPHSHGATVSPHTHDPVKAPSSVPQMTISTNSPEQHFIPPNTWMTPPVGSTQVTYSRLAVETVGVSIQSSGSGSPFSIVPRHRTVNWIIKAH